MLKYNGTCGRTRRGSCTDGERRRCQGSSGCGEVVWVRRASSLFLHLFLHRFHLFLHLHCFFIGFFICFGFFTVSSLLFLHLHCATSCDPILLSCSRYQPKLIASLSLFDCVCSTARKAHAGMVQRQKAAREQRRVEELERIRLRRVAEEARQRDEAEAQRRREELAREQQRLAALAQIQAEAVVLLQVRGATCWYYLLRYLWSNWEHRSNY